MSNENINPCRYCKNNFVNLNADAEAISDEDGNDSFGAYYVICLYCGARGPKGDKENAIAYWNERKTIWIEPGEVFFAEVSDKRS